MGSIKAKIAMTVALGILVICTAVGYQFHRSFQNTMEATANESLRQSAEVFDNLSHDNLDLMKAASRALLANPELNRAFEERNREALSTAVKPYLAEFKSEYGVTHWNYWEPEPGGQGDVNGLVNFLRAPTPERHGDFVERVTLAQVAERKEVFTGLELGYTGFVLRVLQPMYRDGQLDGYFEMGKEIGNFLQAMKAQTGNEYGLVLLKEKLSEEKWAYFRKSQQRENNWNDMPNLVLSTNTTDDPGIFNYDGSLAGLPEDGRVLGLEDRNGRVYTRGVLPLRDITGETVGGLFVLRDITGIHAQAKETQNQALATVFVLLGLIGAGMVTLFHRLIVVRLERLIKVATRVVGGEFETQVVPSAQDEIGRFESLFEQFRSVFVDLVRQMQQNEESEEQERKAA